MGALAVGGLTVALGGVLYLQYKSEQRELERLYNDIYSPEQVTAYLEEELYESYPIVFRVAQWASMASVQLQHQLQGQSVTHE